MCSCSLSCIPLGNLLTQSVSHFPLCLCGDSFFLTHGIMKIKYTNICENTQKLCLSHSKCHVNISYYYQYFGKHLEGLAHRSQWCLQFTARSQSVFQNPLKLQLTNGGLEPHLVIKILSAKACAITLQNPTLCRLPFMSH